MMTMIMIDMQTINSGPHDCELVRVNFFLFYCFFFVFEIFLPDTGNGYFTAIPYPCLELLSLTTLMVDECFVLQSDEPSSEGGGDNFLMSAQSPEQKDLLSQHSPYRPVFVEGPFNLWLRDVKLGYYILRSDAIYLRSLEGDIGKLLSFVELSICLEKYFFYEYDQI